MTSRSFRSATAPIGELIGIQDRPRRVVGVAQEDGLGPGRDRGLDLLSGNPELGRIGRGQRHRDTAGEGDARAIGHEARLVVDDLVAGVDDGSQGGVQALAGADGDHQLVARHIADVVSVRQVGDQLAQRQDPAVA